MESFFRILGVCLTLLWESSAGDGSNLMVDSGDDENVPIVYILFILWLKKEILFNIDQSSSFQNLPQLLFRLL